VPSIIHAAAPVGPKEVLHPILYLLDCSDRMGLFVLTAFYIQ
jgi:hypothetical protein